MIYPLQIAQRLPIWRLNMVQHVDFSLLIKQHLDYLRLTGRDEQTIALS